MRPLTRNLLAAGLAILLTGGTAIGMRCMSASQASCSLASLTGAAPRLDVPYAESRPEVVAKMLDVAEVGPGDHVVDLGTGDGRILIAAARDRGAGGLGVDIDPVLVRRAQAAARRHGVDDRVAFRTQDLFETPLGGADVVTMFLLPEINLKLRPHILALRPGTRVVSHAFDMGEWRPDRTARAGGARVHYWVVPARVEGRWTMLLADGDKAELVLAQRFQRLTGSLRRDGTTAWIRDGRMEGNRIRFAAEFGEGFATYEGIVRGKAMEGAGGRWRAARSD